MPIDWHEFSAARYEAPTVVDPRRRLRICLAGFTALCGLVFVRATQLELTAGPIFRERAAQPLQRSVPLPADRGRIVDRHGRVLAHDRQLSGLAVQYRWLQEPSDAAWLRSLVRARLTPAERKQPSRVAEETQRALADRAALMARLAELCGASPADWQRRRQAVQARVERIAASVERRRAEAAGRALEAETRSAESGRESFLTFLVETFKASTETAAPVRLVVAEERQRHLMVDEVPADAVAEINAHPERYPGVTIVARRERSYPAGGLAAHVLGHLGPPQGSHAAPGEPQTGLERQYDALLRGQPGEGLELLDHAGRPLTVQEAKAPVSGRDLVLTLDARVQQAAERLLDQALQRREVTQVGPEAAQGGGAIVALDVRDGSILAAASAPRFDPGWFARGDARSLERALHDPSHPLFDRVSAMTIPPGSVFKIVTAIALLESGQGGPMAKVECRGYLDTPDRWRCACFVRHGQGHGAVDLADALAQSCNVYFFDQARRLGPGPLCDWGARLGFGQRTGIDLPGEAAGSLPASPAVGAQSDRWRTANTLELCIGQGPLTASPLQIARLLASVANGGHLVRPHLVKAVREPDDGQTALGISTRTLAAVRRGLERVVAAPEGTGYATVRLDWVAIAGKTGTAQTGAGRADHAWFAGYFPADTPRWVVVVIVEHGGDGSVSAGPPARRLIEQIVQLGL